MENIIKLNTAAMTSNAIKMPRQLRLSGEMATNSYEKRKQRQTIYNNN